MSQAKATKAAPTFSDKAAYLWGKFTEKPDKSKKTTSTKKGVSGKATGGMKKVSFKQSADVKRRVSKNSLLLIQKREQLPSYTSVLDLTKPPFNLSTERSATVCVLLTDRVAEEQKKDTVTRIRVNLVIAESNASGVDNKLLLLLKSLRSHNYIIENTFKSNAELIALIYEEHNKSYLSVDEIEKREREAKLALDFDDLLTDAFNLDVSDIHIETRKDSAIVRFRENGELSKIKDLSSKYALSLATAVYQTLAIEQETTFIPTRQQAARIERLITLKGKTQEVGIRLNTMPVHAGFDVVMRLFKIGDTGSTSLQLKDLGYSEPALNQIKAGMMTPQGGTFVSGTTGSGKSVTMSTMLNQKIGEHTVGDNCSIKVITVEDPSEYVIRHATQMGIVARKDSDVNPYTEAIRAALRSDPDDLMVGECRDSDSAALVKAAIQTGHKVFTTLHTGSAITILERLDALGVEPSVLGSGTFLSTLIYQTLLKKLCPHCSKSYDQMFNESAGKVASLVTRIKSRHVDSGISDQIDFSKMRFRNTLGCDSPQCKRGLVGRRVVAEVLTPTAKMKEMIKLRKYSQVWLEFRQQGGETIFGHAETLCLEGGVDPFDTEQLVGAFNSEPTIRELEESLGVEPKPIIVSPTIPLLTDSSSAAGKPLKSPFIKTVGARSSNTASAQNITMIGG